MAVFASNLLCERDIFFIFKSCLIAMKTLQGRHRDLNKRKTVDFSGQNHY